jgi:hypothetical protein
VDESVLAASLDRIRHRLVVSCGPGTTLEVLRKLPQRHTLRLTFIDQSEGGGT